MRARGFCVAFEIPAGVHPQDLRRVSFFLPMFSPRTEAGLMIRNSIGRFSEGGLGYCL